MEKVKIVLEYTEDDSLLIETVWAEPSGKHFRILNIPFCAKNVALHDIISATKTDGMYKIEKLITPSGNSTIQIIFFTGEELKNTTKDLEKNGCSWEGSHLKKLISVNVPKEVDYQIIKDYLDSKENLDLLSYREACLGFL